MGISRQIAEAGLEDLYLDPTNPRLGRRNTGREVTQERVLELMRGWDLEELALSFMESGFWPQEALVVVNEKLYGAERLVCVEGNRRLAALKYLRKAIGGETDSRKWKEIAESGEPPTGLFDAIPYLLADSRDDVTIFLGFRHVTGIKEWRPAEKAEYIVMLIDKENLEVDDVRRRIGIRADTVRRNYAAYKILLQLEDIARREGVAEEDVGLINIQERFSVLFLSLREQSIRTYLGVELIVDGQPPGEPVPADKQGTLLKFATWLFGTGSTPPLFTDSRYVSTFARVLDSPEAIAYLEGADLPSFDLAVRKARADEPELRQHIVNATDEVEQALSRVHLYADSGDIRKLVDRFARGAIELIRKFPEIDKELLPHSAEATREE